MTIQGVIRRVVSAPRRWIRFIVVCNRGSPALAAEDIEPKRHQGDSRPVARLPHFVKVNSSYMHNQHNANEPDWNEEAWTNEPPIDSSLPLTCHLKPALSLRQAPRLPSSQPHYLLPCEKPRSSAQTMLKRRATLKMLEGDVPMEVGGETRWYGSTKKERLEERQWMMRRSRVERGIMMLEERLTGDGNMIDLDIS